MTDELTSAALYDQVAQASAAAVIEGYSTSFGWACRLLAAPVRSHVRNIYALVRLADEIVDGAFDDVDEPARRAILDDLEAETMHAFRTGHSTNLIVHASALTVRRFEVDPALFTAFFTSMRMDLTVTEHTSASFATYVYGSAEVVGLMCLQVFLGAEDDASAAAGTRRAGGKQARQETLVAGARALGSAFQKINFLRDLAADHDDLGRTYFPGFDPRDFTDARRDELVTDIRADLAVARKSIDLLPTNSRVAVAAAYGLFAELTRRIAATPATTLRSTRLRVPTPVKARILAAAALTGGRK